MTTVSRKIQFFNVEMLVHNVARNALEVIEDQVPVSEQIINQINTLEFTNNQPSRYLEVDENNDLFMLIDSRHDGIAGRLITSRKNLLPEVERQGQLTPLAIPLEAGLAEATHFVFFPEDRVLGLEFNFFGPRPSKFSEYIPTKASNLVNVINLHPILRLDVEEQLRTMGEVSLLQIEAHRNAVGILNELNESLGSAFEAAANLSEAETVEIILRKRRYSREGFNFPFAIRRLTELLSRTENRELLNKFRGVACNTQQEQNNRFDFLDDKMIVSRQIARVNERSRAVDTVSMHLAIREAFRELREQIVFER